MVVGTQGGGGGGSGGGGAGLRADDCDGAAAVEVRRAVGCSAGGGQLVVRFKVRRCVVLIVVEVVRGRGRS